MPCIALVHKSPCVTVSSFGVACSFGSEVRLRPETLLILLYLQTGEREKAALRHNRVPPKAFFFSRMEKTLPGL